MLLVARRRGHVPSGETLSITQMELAEARRRGIDVLPFLLDDSVDEDRWPWEEKENVQAWRADIKEHFGVGTSKKTPASLKIGPALARWITEQGPKVALRLYLQSVKQHHGYIKFLGLPRLEDIQDAPIQRLFVEPAVADRPVSPEIDPKEWPKTTPVRDALAEHPRLVLLGDPGSGKSTLVDWLAWRLAEGYDGTSRLPSGTSDAQKSSGPAPSRPARQAGRTWHNLVPLPMILRELRIGAGITWETLLQAFVIKPFGKLLTLANLERILKDGRAAIMLDGLDEIGDPHVRGDLRDAVWNGIDRYPECRWILTSRIVGYHDVRFDQKEFPRSVLPRIGDIDEQIFGLEMNSRNPNSVFVSLMPIRGIAPFDDPRVERFAENWFVLREKTAHRAKQGAKDLLAAIRGNESTTKLGRIPNLLTMMALIYRVRARLPHGRALLYNEIAQAYLETIDFFRQITTRTEPLADKKRWIARVGFEMQRQRSLEGEAPAELRGSAGTSPSHGGEIFATGDDVRQWIAAAMGESLEQRSDEDAAEFVDYLGRRAGLLLPRGQDQFSFMHLSFQEYFAACYLQNQIASPDWLLDDEGIPEGARKEDLRSYAGQTVWRETLVFLIELLAPSDQPKWLKPTHRALFGQDYAEVRDAGESARGQAALLARLAADPHAGFTADERWRVIDTCCSWEARAQKRQARKMLRHEMDVPQALLATVSVSERQRILSKLVTQAHKISLHKLSLYDTAISDLTPLSGLTRLRELGLYGTTVSDLTPLSGLLDLRILDLGCTPTLDLSPLAGLTSLQRLYLSHTQVSDLTPLSGMASLRELWLDYTHVSDLESISELRTVRVYLDKSQKVKVPKELEGRVHRVR